MHVLKKTYITSKAEYFEGKQKDSSNETKVFDIFDHTFYIRIRKFEIEYE